MEQERTLNLFIRECLKNLGVTLLCDWDVLIFLYRHQSILADIEQIARLLSYPSKLVRDALETLETLKLVQRSRASRDVQLYQFCIHHPLPESSFRQLMGMAESRAGRLLLVKELGNQGVGLHLAEKGRNG